MAKARVDKNLSNVVEDLDKVAVNRHHAQQIQQDVNNRNIRCRSIMISHRIFIISEADLFITEF